MSLLAMVTMAAVAFASAGAGYVAAVRAQKKKAQKAAPSPPGGADAKRSDEAAAPKTTWPGIALHLNDVVSADGDERWLAGALAAAEGTRIAAVVFFAPEGAAQAVVVAFAPPRREVLWLMPCAVETPREPPASLWIDGAAMTRKRRLPVTFSRHGQGVPDVTDDGLFAEYEGGPDQAALVLTWGTRAMAWSGKRIHEDRYERMGSGGAET